MMRVHLQKSALLLACAAMSAAAQSKPPALEPVHWSAESALPRSLHASTRFDVLLHATIDTGWHLYALPESDAFPLATEVALARTASVDLLRVDEERPQRHLEGDSRTVTAWFTQSATFTLRLSAMGTQPPHDLQVLVRYQACNDRMCLPQKEATVPVQLHSAR